MWSATVLTIHPEMFPGPLQFGICGRALKNKIWQIKTVHLREYCQDTHKNVDAPPTGGGAGMILRADILAKAFDHHYQKTTPAFVLSPRGRTIKQQDIKNIAQQNGIMLICGRFEGIDQRFIDNRPVEEISIGDYIIAGGEIAAMVIIEAVVRLIPQTIGNQKSLHEETFHNGLLEYPQYTKPNLWSGNNIPKILLSGNHQEIKKWRTKQAIELTKKIRPDLLK